MSLPDVLESVAAVVPMLRHVRPVAERLPRYARELAGAAVPPEDGVDALLFRGDREACAQFVLISDALNFCFWSENPWSVEYRGRRWTRTYAMMAGLLRAIEADASWLTAARWASATSADVARIFAGVGAIPLAPRRLEILHETGTILGKRFGGSFVRLVEEAGGDAYRLAYLLAELFPSFCDVASYRGRTVAFLKRAQICTADLHRVWQANGHAGLTNRDRLTVFADYRLPQLFRHEGLLAVSDELARRIDSGAILPAGSEEEVELRVATIWLSKLLADALAELGHGQPMWELDYVLWTLARRPAVTVPHHRTITTAY